jgi:hypothetical protein
LVRVSYSFSERWKIESPELGASVMLKIISRDYLPADTIIVSWSICESTNFGHHRQTKPLAILEAEAFYNLRLGALTWCLDLVPCLGVRLLKVSYENNID